MSRLFSSALAAATVLVVSLGFIVFGVGAKNVDAQFSVNATPVQVVNSADSPVLVMDAKARGIPWRQWTMVHLDNTDYRSEPVVTVPKGYNLRITDINVNACSEVLRDTIAVNLTLWPADYPGSADPNNPPPVDEIPRTVVLLQNRGVFRSMVHYGGTQQPNQFFREGETVWVEAYRTLGKGHGEAATWVQGVLEPAAVAPPTGERW
jgi:hypothetical protein